MFKRKRWQIIELEYMFKLKQYCFSTKSIAKHFNVTIFSIYKQMRLYMQYLNKFNYLNMYLNDRQSYEQIIYNINNKLVLNRRLHTSELEYIKRYFMRKNIQINISTHNIASQRICKV